jgi:hypothetical protein
MADLKAVAQLAGVSRQRRRVPSRPPSWCARTPVNRVVAAGGARAGFSAQSAGAADAPANHPADRRGGAQPAQPGVRPSSSRPLEQAARARGYNLLLATTDYQAERESDVVEELLRQRVDGLVLPVTDARSNHVLQSLAQEDTPFVLAYHQPEDAEYSAVSVDNHAGHGPGYSLLLEAGHRRIGMVAGSALQSDRAAPALCRLSAGHGRGRATGAAAD